MKKSLLFTVFMSIFAVLTNAQSPIMYIDFEDRITDQSGNNHDLIMADSIAVPTPLVYGSSDKVPTTQDRGKYGDFTANIPGAAPGVTVLQTSKGIFNAGTGSYTLTGWFKFPEKLDPGQALLSQDTLFMYRVFGNATGYWGSMKYDGVTKWKYSKPADLMQWFHLAIVFDNANGKATYYFDGVKGFEYSTSFPNIDSKITIGGFENGMGSCKVLVDELCLFNQVLTVEEIQSNMESVATNISEIKLDGVRVYPNPAKDVLNISLLNTNEAVVEIVSLSGNVMHKETISQEASIQLSKYANGIYFVRVTSGNSSMVKKIVKN